MEGFTLQRLLNAIGTDAESVAEKLRNKPVSGISIDSRNVSDGDVFFGLRGDHFDGGKYADKAAQAGAILSVVNTDTTPEEPYQSPVAVVDNTVHALAKVAADYRMSYDGTVIAVTGTSGKTTVKEMLLAVLGKQMNVHGTAGNYNNHIGLPLSIIGLRPSHDCAVFELGMSASGEIATLADICRPSIGVVLNVGAGHAEFFNSIDEIADAKMELISAIPSDGTAIINGDDPRLADAGSRTDARLIRFGMNCECDFRAEDIVIEQDGCPHFHINGNPIKLKVPGFHNIYNALAAYAVASVMGLDKTLVAESLAAFEAPDKRMQRIPKNGITYFNDTYNANPLSMSAAAEVLKMSDGNRKIAVLGDMLELGSLSEMAHYDIGRRFAEIGVDQIFLVGKYACKYAEGAIRGGLDAGVIHQFTDAIGAGKYLLHARQRGDIILVKGSRGVHMDRIIDMLVGE